MNTHDEDRLDRLLDAYAIDAPSPALRQRVLASAPSRAARRPWFALGPMWLSGAGLAAACAFGVIVGADVGGASVRAGAASDTDAAVAFGDATAFGAVVDPGQAG